MRVRIEVIFINELQWKEEVDFQSPESMEAWIDYRSQEGWSYLPVFRTEADAKRFGFGELVGGGWAWFRPVFYPNGRVHYYEPALMALVDEEAK